MEKMKLHLTERSFGMDLEWTLSSCSAGIRAASGHGMLEKDNLAASSYEGEYWTPKNLLQKMNRVLLDMLGFEYNIVRNQSFFLKNKHNNKQTVQAKININSTVSVKPWELLRPQLLQLQYPISLSFP